MQKPESARPQINVRIEEDLLRLLDAKRAALRAEVGFEPSRSDIVRMALERFLKGPAARSKQ